MALVIWRKVRRWYPVWVWVRRFGHRGVWGWFVAQWHRVIRLKPDYRMVAPDRPLSPGEGYGAVGSSDGGALVRWGSPACSLTEEQRRRTLGADVGDQGSAQKKMPDWSGLSDEELAERLKRPCLGTGLLAEAGYRAFRKNRGGK